MQPDISNNYVKVVFQVKQDAYGNPPFKFETLWCKKRGDHFVVENTPAFIQNISYGDEIEIVESESVNYFERMIKESGNSSISIYLNNDNRVARICAELQKLGCHPEASQGGLIAVLVPEETEYRPVTSYLTKGEKMGEWTFVENARRHK